MKEKNYREDELPDLDQQLESLPDESGYHDQKKKAEGKSRSRRTDGEPKKKVERSRLKNGQRRPKETQAERSGASKKKEKQMTNKELTRVTYIFVTLFLVLMGYLVYFNVVKSKEVVNSTYNIRQDLLADRVLRGSITDKNGEVLAQTVTNDDGSETREYPEGEVFAHVVGYAAKGKSGLESSQNFNLLTSNAFFLEKLANEFKDQKNTGDTVVTTLDANLQNAAYNALGDNKGAVVVMEPSTGKILAMVSKPSFDPNNVSENWDALNNDENSSLLNRATLGQYTPGSTFKLVTTLAFMRQNPDYNNYSFECNGEFSQNGATIHCYNSTAHGEENLTDSVANSCNSSFSNIGLQLDKAEWRKTAKQMLFNGKLPGDVKYNESSFRLKTDAGDAACPAEAEMDSLEGADVAGSGRSDSVLIETFSTLPVVSVLPNTSSNRPVPDTAAFDPLPFSAPYPGISSETDIISACDAPRRFVSNGSGCSSRIRTGFKDGRLPWLLSIFLVGSSGSTPFSSPGIFSSFSAFFSFSSETAGISSRLASAIAIVW